MVNYFLQTNIKKRDQLYVLIYVDDILVTGLETKIDEFKQFISNRYSIKMPGEVTRFCWIDITRTTNEIIFSQETYVQELLKK